MHVITRRIEIDAGHRIPDHESKCRNLHGHRYVIELSVSGDLLQTGSETGMVKDFGILKKVMMDEIDALFDHCLILGIDDPILVHVAPSGTSTAIRSKFEADHYTCYEVQGIGETRVVLIKSAPTAENLAELWFYRLQSALLPMAIRLVSVKVFETPNCWAIHLPGA